MKSLEICKSNLYKTKGLNNILLLDSPLFLFVSRLFQYSGINPKYLSVKYSLIIQKINFPLFVIFIRRSIKKKRTKGRLLFDNHVVVYVQIRDV